MIEMEKRELTSHEDVTIRVKKTKKKKNNEMVLEKTQMETHEDNTSKHSQETLEKGWHQDEPIGNTYISPFLFIDY